MAEELHEAVDGFFLAAEYGRSDVIKALADHGRGRLSLGDVVDPVTGRSPLHVAVASGKKDALRVLLAAGFPPAHQSNDKQSAYALAQQLKAQDLLLVFRQFLVQQVAANDVASVRQLLKAGVDVGVADAATGGSLLHWAASCQAVDVLRDLLSREDVQQQQLVDARNGDGATPLHLACHANSVECTRLLLENHANTCLKGDKGFSQDKTALELATKPEVRELFTKSVEKEGEKVKETKIQDSSEGDKEGEGGELCGLTTGNGERRASGTCPHEAQNGKLLLQLEEKDLLVNQLKKTIEALVQESQEVEMLGEERVMLDYVRKLRDEKAVVQRQLEDANDYIKDQQQQLSSLKEQIRQMAVAGKQQPETDHDILSHTSDGTASSVAVDPPNSTNSIMSALDLHQLEGQLDAEDEKEPQKPRAHPLKLDAWTSKAQREQETYNRYVEKHGPDIWSTVWNGIWTGKEEDEEQDEDGEVIMTV